MHDQGHDDFDDLDRARRRAFSRGATDADLATLRELEARAEESSAADPVPVTAERPGDPREHPGVRAEAEDVPGPRGRAWARPAAFGAIGGVLLGVLLATVTSPLFWAREPESLTQFVGDPTRLEPSLAIFDRTPSERDILGAAGFPQLFDPEAGTPEVRWLADVDGATVYVGRGEQRGDTAICLIAIRANSASGSCSGVAEFEASGIGGDYGGLLVRWGPDGLDAWVPYVPDPQ